MGGSNILFQKDGVGRSFPGRNDVGTDPKVAVMRAGCGGGKSPRHLLWTNQWCVPMGKVGIGDELGNQVRILSMKELISQGTKFLLYPECRGKCQSQGRRIRGTSKSGIASRARRHRKKRSTFQSDSLPSCCRLADGEASCSCVLGLCDDG